MGIGLLLGDFPRAICQILVTPTPVVWHVEGTIQEWYDHSLLLTQGTQELTALAIILCWRHEQWIEELSQEFPAAREQLVEMGLDLDLVSGVVNPNE